MRLDERRLLDWIGMPDRSRDMHDLGERHTSHISPQIWNQVIPANALVRARRNRRVVLVCQPRVAQCSQIPQMHVCVRDRWESWGYLGKRLHLVARERACGAV